VEESLTALITAIEDNVPAIIVGAALLALTVFVRTYLEPKLEGAAQSWISAGAAWVGGIAALLVAGQVWWHALILGGLVSATSSGFLRLLAEPVAAWVNGLFKGKPKP
jgi:hypothetical protein